MADQLLTPSKITAWLDCPHYLTLKHQVDGGARPKPPQPFGSFAELLMAKGLKHEEAVLDRYEAAGRRVEEVPEWDRIEPFATWAERHLPALEAGAEGDVLYQMPFVHDGMRGIADFLERVVDPDTGRLGWEPVDAKLARSAAKPGHVLQLCFYAAALAAQTGVAPRRLAVSLGSGRTEEVGFEAVRPYWDRLRAQLRTVMAADPAATETKPEPCDHCTFCEFEATCEQTWRDADALHYVAGIRRNERAALEAAGVDTLAGLAALGPDAEPVPDVRPERLARLQVQAELQVEARALPEDAKPPFVLVTPSDDDLVWGHGFELLPEPDPGDLFLDFEGHPFWRADRGLFFLFGYIEADAASPSGWRYVAHWAFDEAGERRCVETLVQEIVARRAQHPGMHVYHYNHTERSALEALATEHAVAEAALADLVDTGAFVDLYLVARNALQAGVESYGLKHLERLTDYERSHDIDAGAGAVVAFDQYTVDGEQAHLDAIAAYNEDDVRATRALRDWLLAQRPAGTPWRAAHLEAEPQPEDLDELLERLAGCDHDLAPLVADLLGYWLREARAQRAPLLGKLCTEPEAHLDAPDVLGGLGAGHLVEVLTKTGKKAKRPRLRLQFPPQQLERGFGEHRITDVLYATPEGLPGFTSIDRIDVEAGEVDLVWTERCEEIGVFPEAVMANDWVHPKPKPEAVTKLAWQLLDPATHGEPNPATLALLRGDAPRFVPGGGPAGGRLGDDPADVARWATELDAGVLAVQGPPGTGKTYRGAHMAKALVAAGKRVGITAMSHNAIDNFLAELQAVFAAEPALELRVIRKPKAGDHETLPGVTYTTDNAKLAGDGFDVVAGTTWPFASEKLREHPVDVLLVDEAGQLALADAVAASMAARSVVLLGDPQQLPQVAQATHPGRSGDSALGHLLPEGHDTLSDERGVFISETRRMHPDVCRFISDRIYEGRLTSYVDCAKQSTEVGTGLRWLRVDHEGCATESVEEADAVQAQIRDLLGRTWTDKDGVSRPLGVDDILVVAPYNDQVRLLREHLDAVPETKGVQVGTVDRFQGRQAPVVLFTMTSSSAHDMPRGADFLFSRNRLNVAISRAQCLAYLVCTEALLESRAGTVEEMLLIATLCAFAEGATEVAAAGAGDAAG